MEIQTPEKPKSSPWNEVMGLILISSGFVFVLALISYHADDPSWTSTGGYRRAKNLAGPIGANIASFIYQALGVAGWLLPGVLFVMGWWQWTDTRKETNKAELVGIFLLIVALTGFLTLIPWEPNSFRLGGFVGYWLVKDSTIGISRYIGIGGAFVALVLLLIVGLILATPLSVSALLKKLRDRPHDQNLIQIVVDWLTGLWQKPFDEEDTVVRVGDPSETDYPRAQNSSAIIVKNGGEESLKPVRQPRRPKPVKASLESDDDAGYGQVSIGEKGENGETNDESLATTATRSSRGAATTARLTGAGAKSGQLRRTTKKRSGHF